MDIEITPIDDYTTIKPLEIRLDKKTAETFKDEIRMVINDNGPHILIDLSNIKFMDSSGLGAIITSLKLVATTGDIVLCGVEPEVLQLFKLTRMDKVFSIISCNDDPEKHFRNK